MACRTAKYYVNKSAFDTTQYCYAVLMSFKFLTNLPSATETVIIIACLHVWTSTSVVLADEANAINHRATTTSKNKWELSPKNAHPRAVALLKDSFYWSILDDDSPFGNDNGADALTAYRKWRNQHRIGTAVDFIRELLTSFQAPLSEWKMLKASDINTSGSDKRLCA